MAFVKATRTRAYIKIALTGPSGSGKTLSALKLARGLAGDGKIALIDTENESASLYADATDFDTCPIAAPFTTEKYIAAIQDAADAGYSVLIIDSLTHAWAGEGGLLSQKESLDSRGGNQYTNWASITKKQEQLKAKMLQSPIHVIATMRSKQEYAVEQNSNGKSAPKKVGMAPIQREGMEYEFTIVLDMGMNHEFAASKDRTGLFDGKYEVPKESHGAAIRAWLESGAEPAPEPQRAVEAQQRQQDLQPRTQAPPANPVPVVKKPNPDRDAFDAVAAKCGLEFLSGKDRGEWANTCLGRVRDSVMPFTPQDWKDAADALPELIAAERRSREPVNAAPVVEAAKAEAQLDAEGESLTDPFAEEGEDPFDKIPAGQPTHAKSKKSAPANSLPGTDRTATDSRATGSPAGML